MAEKKQEKPKIPEAKSEQTVLYKFGNMIAGILSSVLGSNPKSDKKPETVDVKPNKDK